MDISRAEIDERLRRAAEIRRSLRRATRKLMELGERALKAREITKPTASGSLGNRSR